MERVVNDKWPVHNNNPKTKIIFALIKLPRIWNTYTIPILPTYVGGKREEEKLSMLPEDIGNFSP